METRLAFILKLSYRKRKIVEMLCEGASFKDVAFALEYNPRALEKAIQDIYDRAAVFSKGELISIVLKTRIAERDRMIERLLERVQELELESRNKK